MTLHNPHPKSKAAAGHQPAKPSQRISASAHTKTQQPRPTPHDPSWEELLGRR